MKPYSCLAVDMGAASIRVVQGIFTDRLELREIHRFENHIEWIDGADRWNLKKITEGIQSGIAKAFDQTEVPIVSVGVDSWGVDFVLIGDDGQPLEDAISYRDKRTIGMKEKWNETMSANKTFQLTGINYYIFNTLYQLLSMKGSVQLKKTRRILFMADYINYQLSGKAVNELTLSATSQMVNYKNGDFDPIIVDLLDAKQLVGKPVLPGEKLGRLTNFELNNTEVIVVAGHDTACAVAAIPFTNNNSAFISTGTWCIAGMISDKPLISDRAFELGITNEVTADGKFRPSKNLIGLWLVQQLRVSFNSHLSYSEIESLVEREPLSTYLIDASDESFYNPSSMKEAFDSYLESHFSVQLKSEAEYYRCAYDSLAESFRRTILDFEEIRGRAFNTIHLIGGGSQSKVLCQLTANVTGKRIIAGPVEAAVIGNLLIQAESLGFIGAKKAIAESTEKEIFLPV
jgi:sugar (pentulose or hexulose) kinase